MKAIFKLLGASILLGLCANTHAYQRCIKNTMGQLVCSPKNGGIATNSTGQVVCGVGRCVTNSVGQVICSSKRGGSATKNSIDQVTCTDGCTQASPDLCKQPSQSSP